MKSQDIGEKSDESEKETFVEVVDNCCVFNFFFFFQLLRSNCLLELSLKYN